MKIRLWGINYHPEPIGIAVYSRNMCQHLAAAGHEVSVVTAFPYYPVWRLDKDDCVSFRTDEIDGIKVYRNWTYIPKEVRTRTRIVHELSFTVTSTLRQLTLPAPDVYFIVSPPLLLGLAAWFISLIKRRPFVFHIQDLQPEAAISLGLIKQKWLITLLTAIECFVYRCATKISVISREMEQSLLKKGVPPEKIAIVPNSIRTDEEFPVPGTWKKKRGLDDSVNLVTYSGNIGVKQGLDCVLDAADLLAARNGVKFVICGDGADKMNLTKGASQRNLNNVMFLEILPTEEYRSLLIDSDLCLVTLKSGTGASFLPSKLLNILAAGRPVVTNADPGSALHTAVTTGGFGIACAGGGRQLAEAIELALSDRAKIEIMSEAGRDYVQRFDEKKVMSDLTQLLETLAAKRTGRVANGNGHQD